MNEEGSVRVGTETGIRAKPLPLQTAAKPHGALGEPRRDRGQEEEEEEGRGLMLLMPLRLPLSVLLFWLWCHIVASMPCFITFYHSFFNERRATQSVLGSHERYVHHEPS